MKLETFFEKFDLLAEAPGGVGKLRELILHWAVRGKLVPSDPRPTPAAKSFPGFASVAVNSGDDGLPPHWLRVPLGKAGEWRGGGTPSKANAAFWDGDVPWVSPKDMKSLRISDAQDHISEAAVAASSVSEIPAGSILMVVRGMILARAFPVALTTRAVTINQDMKALTPREKGAAEFLLLALRASEAEVLSAVERSSHGTCKLSTGFLNAFTIPIPPLGEMKRIVAKVDELMALCDRLEAQQKERETHRATLAQAALTRFAEAPTSANLNFLFHDSYTIDPADLRSCIRQLAVQGKLVRQDTSDSPAGTLLAEILRAKQGPIDGKKFRQGKVSRPQTTATAPDHVPAGWVWTNVDSLCFKVTDGTHFTPRYVEHGVRFVSAKDIAGGRLVFDRCKHISQEEHERLFRRCNPEWGDIVISKSGSIGTVAVVEDLDEFSLFESLALLKFDQKSLYSRYLVVALSHACSRLSAGHIRGVGVKHLHLDILRGLELALPPLPEQKRIVARMDELMLLVDGLEGHLRGWQERAELLVTAMAAGIVQPA